MSLQSYFEMPANVTRQLNPFRLVRGTLEAADALETTVTHHELDLRDMECGYTIETPQKLRSKSAVVVAGGFCALELSYSDLRNQLATTDERRVVTLSPPQFTLKGYIQALRNGTYSTLQSNHLIAVMDDVQKRYNIPAFDFVGHSLGGRTIGNAVQTETKKCGKQSHIKSATFVATAGGDGSNLFDLAKRAPRFFLGEFKDDLPDITRGLRKDKKTALKQAQRYYGNPAEVALEGIAASSYDILPDLITMRKYGVATGAVLPDKDSLFSSTRSIDSLAMNLGAWQEMEGDHNAPIVEPEKTAVALRSVWEQLGR